MHRLLLIAAILCSSCQSSNRLWVNSDPALPRVDREFRAAWIASVANINWPSRPGLSPEAQRAEALTLLDMLQELHYNAVILQVRPQCDALYPSTLEPWSYYLTGAQGVAPDPPYDPLRFWIEEAHARGLELHAWLNPYRAHHSTGGTVSEHSIIRKKPGLVVALENGFWWMDPAQSGTQDHSYAVVMDLVDRYDLDGIHFDDYFYPYPSYNGGKDFPDEKSWQAYQAGGGSLTRGDWRREAVNTFIKRVYRGIKKRKPYVKFGLSPFGIWRPNHPASIQGFDQYDQLYADARLWLQEGWIDYWTPQLYWPINQIPQSFPVLLGWWIRQNVKGRHIWPGLSIGRLSDTLAADEIQNQIMISRGMLPDAPGTVHWSIGPVQRNDTLRTALGTGPYRRPALVPAMPWLHRKRPKAPTVTIATEADHEIKVAWSVPAIDMQIGRFVLHTRYGNDWSSRVLPSIQRDLIIARSREDKKGRLNRLLLSTIDRYGQESRPFDAEVNR